MSAVVLNEQDERKDYTQLIQSYGYDEEIANSANAILYTTMRSTNHAVKKKMEAIWMAHNKLGRTCDVHLISDRIRKKEQISKSARIKILPEKGIVRIRTSAPYIPIYLEELRSGSSLTSPISSEVEEKMIHLASRIDATDGLPVILPNVAVAVIRTILDEEGLTYKKEQMYKDLGKNSSTMNVALDYLNTWLMENN